MVRQIKTLTAANFMAEVIDSAVPVLVFFSAPWCGPCKMIAPTVEAVAIELDGKVTVGKLDTDDTPTIASEYGVNAIPTLLVFRNGTVVSKLVGVVYKSRIIEAINEGSGK